MSLWWVGKYIPDRNKFGCSRCWGFWSSSTPAGARIVKRCFLPALTRSPPWLYSGNPGGRSIESIYRTWRRCSRLLLQQQIAKRLHHRYHLDPKLQGAMIIIGGLSVWLFVSDWIIELARQTGNQGSYLTATYSALALVFFIAGIALRERVTAGWAWEFWRSAWAGYWSSMFGKSKRSTACSVSWLSVLFCSCWDSSTTNTRRRLRSGCKGWNV